MSPVFEIENLDFSTTTGQALVSFSPNTEYSDS